MKVLFFSLKGLGVFQGPVQNGKKPPWNWEAAFPSLFSGTNVNRRLVQKWLTDRPVPSMFQHRVCTTVLVFFFLQ